MTIEPRPLTAERRGEIERYLEAIVEPISQLRSLGVDLFAALLHAVRLPQIRLQFRDALVTEAIDPRQGNRGWLS